MRHKGAKVLLLCITCSFFFLGGMAKNCILHERDALLTFKHGITNDTENTLASWQLHQDCCRWKGVTCSNFTGHVVKLDLRDAELLGQIISSLLSLEYLEYLDLSTNFQDRPIQRVPEFLGLKKNLRHLDLSYVPFSCTVPPLFGNLTKLEYLSLRNTSFFGRLPPQFGNLSNLQCIDLGWMQNPFLTDISWMANLHFLESMDLSNINLSTIVDFPLVANMIPTLKYIRLRNCSLPSANQSVPHLNLTTLEELDLSQNYFGHSFGSCWFWNITSIKKLDLYSSYLGGDIPHALGRMVSLQRIDFSNNGNAATMTVDLKNLCELQILWLDSCLSSGNITQLVEKLPRCSSKLFSLSSSSNNLTGVLPNIMGHLTGLDYIDLSDNRISGPIPPEVGKLPVLGGLYLGSNQLSGQIPLLPTSITILDISMNYLSGHLPLKFGGPNLVIVSLSSNFIEGELPESICESQDMQFLDLSNNLFQGELPVCSCMQYMSFLLLSNNSFSGVFPSWIQCMPSMVFLDLSWNKLHGTLPRWIGDMEKLHFLQLSYNMFSGDIPESIMDLRALQYLNLASNNISGLMPVYWSKLVAMTQKYPVGPEDDSYISLLIGLSRQEILSVVMMHGVFRYGPNGIVSMVGIDLSLNYITGEIPDQITTLDRLLDLNLSCNQLSGKIPENIGSMKSLEWLDLSRNNLSSEIPPSLSDLTYLSSLDMSYNNLTGPIPSGRQLDTLYSGNPSIYEGDSGLCGPPLGRNCTGRNSDESGNEIRSENDSKLFFYFGLGSGFIVGLWVVFCVLLSKKTWRVGLLDQLYVFLAVTWGRVARQGTTD
ncbi:hypothetical protein QOZ80_UnG0727900 [Eleusine coracana subsp. coracana]|uniref:Leucine-rich repeat-containing N-terminal plant-type domain-containing protein n=1 Tax=Eleusine coracana subsp. coracana TaxID=191504 RepID=A0AAV9G3T5_ELECO|nr:hypothetical protein QOZ80_UnG0727900 [Eleusine coracana subsp. coracana]